jgi:DNA-binding NarL/FixJ family response regulator
MDDVRRASEHGGRTLQPGCTRERHASRHAPRRRAVAGGTATVLELMGPVAAPPRHPNLISQLTPKEREVLALVAEGSSNDGIAERLSVTARTVETHTSRIFAKLGLLADPANHRRVLAALVHLRATAVLTD